MFLFFIAFISGLLTILSPCIWSILPILLASVRKNRLSALSLSLGVITTYLILTFGLSYTLVFLTINPHILRLIASSILLFLGSSMLIPQFNQMIETAVSRLTSRFRFSHHYGGNSIDSFLTGASLGILWTPCSGPVMSVIATLAASEIVTLPIVLTALCYSVGIAVPILILSLSEQWFVSHHSYLNNHTGLLQKFFGIVTIISAVLMYTQYDKVLQEYIFSHINIPLINNKLETLPSAQTEIEKLRSLRTNTAKNPYNRLDIYKNINTQPTVPAPRYKSTLPYLGKAYEIEGITKWFNTATPLTLSQYPNKVILLDFWAYTCAACLPSIPRKNDMQKIYPNLVIIALHEPSTRDGKSEENVKRAIEQYGVKYPVGMDNTFTTWDKYKNTYLPSEYVIDTQGDIRFISTNGGDTDKVENAVQELLKESGQ